MTPETKNYLDKARTHLGAVEDFVALNAWQIGKIEAGIEAADRGEFASDDEVARVRAKFAPEL